MLYHITLYDMLYCIYIYIHTPMYVYTYTYICMCIYIYIERERCICVYIYLATPGGRSRSDRPRAPGKVLFSCLAVELFIIMTANNTATNTNNNDNVESALAVY